MIGGISGDMFLAAAADLEPELEGHCLELLARIHGMPGSIDAEFSNDRASGKFGRSFRVTDHAALGGPGPEHEVHLDHDHSDAHRRHGGHDHLDHHDHVHGHDHHQDGQHYHRSVGFQDALAIVDRSEVSAGVRARATDIFTHLAYGEGAAHGVEPRDVHFHEVGGWDSVIDIILSAAVIEQFGDADWLCGPVPLGRGSIEFSHGRLPVPAPATTEILRGFSVFQDEFVGERVTPTGAAILKHLQPGQGSGLPLARLLGCGTGYGSRTLPGLSNTLRIFRLDRAGEHLDHPSPERVSVIEFEVDDQTPEDLAIGLQTIREQRGVLDVTQTPVYGKKGRLGMQVQVLSEPGERESVVRTCLSATSSIGVRWFVANRTTLQRQSMELNVNGTNARIKLVRRPDGEVTGKVEADDLAHAGRTFASRERLRDQARRAASDDTGEIE
jgi:hypothetical protein